MYKCGSGSLSGFVQRGRNPFGHGFRASRCNVIFAGHDRAFDGDEKRFTRLSR
jgi:hypothetical protein